MRDYANQTAVPCDNFTSTYCGVNVRLAQCLKCESASRGFQPQEKVLVGAFSVIVKTGCGTDGALHSTSVN